MTTKEETSNEALLIAYKDTFECFRHIGDFRTKLMTLLPLSSGGILSLITLTSTNHSILRMIGFFGFWISLGLFIYDMRVSRQCSSIIKTGRKLEEKLKIQDLGTFSKFPNPGGIFGANIPGYIIYISTMLFWIVIAIKPEALS